MVLGLFLFSSATISQSQPDTLLIASYDVHWKGLRIMTIDSRSEISDDHYSQAITMRTRGLLKLFVDGRIVASSEGRLGKNATLFPEKYESEGQWDEDYYLRRISYNSDGTPSEIVIDMPEDWLDREPVPEELQHALDPLSLIIYAISDPWNLITNAANDTRDENPSGQMTSFDGLQSMAYQLTCDATPGKVKKRRRTIYEGPAYLCIFTGQQTAGYLRDGDDDKNSDEDEIEIRTIQIWLVPTLDSGQFIPVIIEMKSSRGKIKIFLKEFNQELSLEYDGEIGRLSP